MSEIAVKASSKTSVFSTEHAPVGGYDLVVFDWDGTVLDTTAAISLSIQHAAQKLGLPVPSTKCANSVIGLGWREAMRIIAPTCPIEEYQTFANFYSESYRALEQEVHLFPGIEALIRALSGAGVTLAVATGKSRRGLDRVLAMTGLTDCFSATRTADVCASKPNPEMLEEIGIETCIPPDRTIMVGDTTHDLFMARAYGCRGIGVTYGAMTEDMLREAEPIAICSSVDALVEALGAEALLR